jgi:hypothetical protein
VVELTNLLTEKLISSFTQPLTNYLADPLNGTEQNYIQIYLNWFWGEVQKKSYPYTFLMWGVSLRLWGDPVAWPVRTINQPLIHANRQTRNRTESRIYAESCRRAEGKHTRTVRNSKLDTMILHKGFTDIFCRVPARYLWQDFLAIPVGSRYQPFLCGLSNEGVWQIINDKYREVNMRKNLLNIYYRYSYWGTR